MQHAKNELSKMLAEETDGAEQWSTRAALKQGRLE
jgi:hypothetical protein